MVSGCVTMASRGLSRLVLLALIAALIASAAFVPAATAQDQVDDAEDEADLSQDRSEFESADGGGTEVVASGEDVEETEEEVSMEPAAGVKIAAIFPKATGIPPVIRAGQQGEILFGILNEASGPLKIQGILGKLFLTYDYRMVAQNFTGELPSNITVLNSTVPKGAQSSFAFHFTPFKLLQPMTFGLSATVFYELEGTLHASVLYNSTIDVIEPAGMVSGETIFLMMLGAGVLALVGMWASAQLETLSKRAKRSKKVETGTGDETDVANNEWLQGTFFNANQGKPAQALKQRKKR